MSAVGWALAALALLATLTVGLRARPRAASMRWGRGGDNRYLRVKARSSPGLRFATYNISGGRDRKGRDNLETVARELADVDVVALQEVRDSWTRPGQLRFLSRKLGMAMLCSPTRYAGFRTQRSNALLSRLPLGRWVRYPLPHQHGRHHHYRNVTACEVEVEPGARLVVLFTHLNTGKGQESPGGREAQLREVLNLFLSHFPVVLMGDLNTRADDPGLRRVLARDDVLDAIGAQDSLDGRAMPEHKPRRDWILCRGLEVTAAGSLYSGVSDHPVYWCDARPVQDGVAPEAASAPGLEPFPPAPAAHVARDMDRGAPWQFWRRGGIRNGILGLSLAAALAGSVTPVSILAGTLLLVVGALLIFESRSRLDSGAAENKPVTSGPFRFLRHPVYAGNGLVDLGLALMSGWWVLILATPLWWFGVYLPLIKREEARLQARYGDLYRETLGTLPRLVPDGRVLPPEDRKYAGVDPDRYRRQAGRLFRLASYPLLFVLAWRFVSAGLETVMDPAVIDPLVLNAIIGMGLCAAAWNRHFLDGRRILPGAVHAMDARLAIPALVIVVGLLHAIVETEFYSWHHWLPGLALFAAAIAVFLRYGVRYYFSEALLACGIAVLLEVEWMIPFLVAVYLAMALDRPWSRQRDNHSLFPRRAYMATMSVGLTVSLVVEVAVPLQ